MSSFDTSAFTPDQQFEFARLALEAEHCERMARIHASENPLGKLGELFAALGLSPEAAKEIVLDQFFPKKRKSTAEFYSEMLPQIVEMVKVYQSIFTKRDFEMPPEPVYPGPTAVTPAGTIPADTCAAVLLALLAKQGYGKDEVMADVEATDIEKAQQKAENTFCKLRSSWGTWELEELARILLA